MAARVLFRVLLAPWISGGHFYLAGFFRVSLHGLSERRTIRSKESSVQSKKSYRKRSYSRFCRFSATLFGSGSVIRDHLDHGESEKPMNLWPQWIHWFLRCTMVRVILGHWTKSPQRNAPCDLWGILMSKKHVYTLLSMIYFQSQNTFYYSIFL